MIKFKLKWLKKIILCYNRFKKINWGVYIMNEIKEICNFASFTIPDIIFLAVSISAYIMLSFSIILETAK